MRAGGAAHHRPHGLRAEHQRLLAAAAVEHAVGEDVAALEVGAELYLVDGQEGDVESRGMASTVETQKRGLGGLIFSLAGDERDRFRPHPLGDLVVDPRASSRSGSPMILEE